MIYIVRQLSPATREAALVSAMLMFSERLGIDLVDFYNHMHHSVEYKELVSILRTKRLR